VSRPRIASIVALVATIVGLGASIAAAVDDLGGVPTFCAETGCELVRTSPWARPLGVPMALLGVAFFGAMLVLAFVERPRLRRWLALGGALWAVWLIALQAVVIEAWCTLCMIADPAAIVLALGAWTGARAIALSFARVLAVVPAIGAVVLAVGALTHGARPEVTDDAPVPAFVSAAQAPQGVTVVELLDFECPFCRQMQPRLDAAIARAGVPVTLVRKMMPLPMHAGAVPAALAYCCAELQGKGDAMAKALMEADPEELSGHGCARIAERVGCDMDRYRADMPRAYERVKRDFEEAQAAQIPGLPTLYVGTQRFTGTSTTEDDLVAAIQRAADR
jgi:uncharacterized membrane protein/predicted DsbA family dithiol-disulfide isomerase